MSARRELVDHDGGEHDYVGPCPVEHFLPYGADRAERESPTVSTSTLRIIAPDVGEAASTCHRSRAALLRGMVLGQDDAIDAYISTGAFDALALPFNMNSGWRERHRLRAAQQRNMAVVAYDYYPSSLHPTVAEEPARRSFWDTIKALAAEGTAVIVTTHYMDEAERCGRLGLMSRGHLIALGTPPEVAAQVGGATLEDAFIILQERDEK